MYRDRAKENARHEKMDGKDTLKERHKTHTQKMRVAISYEKFNYTITRLRYFIVHTPGVADRFHAFSSVVSHVQANFIHLFLSQ